MFAAALALTLIGANANAALPACATSISACGCVINSSGAYSLTQALTTSSTSQDCIDIAAPNVHLETHGFAVTGPGGPATNIGIKVRAAAAHADLEFADAATPATFTIISKFGVGIRIAAPGTTGFDFESNNNASDGLVITGAAGSALMDFSTLSNGANGINLAAATSVELDDFGANINSASGIRITGSSGVKMTDFGADNNGGNGLAPFQPERTAPHQKHSVWR